MPPLICINDLFQIPNIQNHKLKILNPSSRSNEWRCLESLYNAFCNWNYIMNFVVQVIAVKQLDRNGLQGNREFLVEVLMLCLLHHNNLVNLIGYCADGQQRLLVYEYMEQGALEDHLFGNLYAFVINIYTIRSLIK